MQTKNTYIVCGWGEWEGVAMVGEWGGHGFGCDQRVVWGRVWMEEKMRKRMYLYCNLEKWKNGKRKKNLS